MKRGVSAGARPLPRRRRRRYDHANGPRTTSIRMWVFCSIPSVLFKSLFVRRFKWLHPSVTGDARRRGKFRGHNRRPYADQTLDEMRRSIPEGRYSMGDETHS
jgi:hypothetical protein